MAATPDPTAVAAAREALHELAARCVEAEEALFATLPVLGEPLPQRQLDGWTDQAVDAVRALAEAAAEAGERLSPHAAATEPRHAPTSDAPDLRVRR